MPLDGHPLSGRDRPRREAALKEIAQALATLPRRVRPASGPAPASAAERPGQPYSRRSYIARQALEERALRHLSRSGQPVVIHGARGFGKSWLLHHLIERVQAEDGAESRATLIDLRDLLHGPGDFYQILAERMVDALDQDPDYMAGWSGWVQHAFAQPGLPLRRLKFLLQTHLLPRSPRRLVLAFDGADVLLGTDQQDGFYGMLRGWAEATSSPGFDKLRILLAVSSAPDQLIRSLKQSPFNLTQPLAVDGLGLDQLAELSRAYDFAPGPAELQRLRDRTQGDPHQARLLLYEAARDGVALAAALAGR